MPKVSPEPIDSEWWRSDAAEGMPPNGAARYIADMTAELARLARSAQLGVLAYLLDMAATEARSTSLETHEKAPPAARSG